MLEGQERFRTITSERQLYVHRSRFDAREVLSTYSAAFDVEFPVASMPEGQRTVPHHHV
jgi:hypothetical protein